MGHDGCYLPAIGQHRHHVLQEHQVRLLGTEWHFAVAEALGTELGCPGGLTALVFVGGAPGDGKRWIGEDAVKAAQLAALDVLRLGQRVFVVQVGSTDAMQQHVHLGDGPHGAVGLLPVQVGLAAFLTLLVDVFLGCDQHAAGATAGIVDVMVQLGLDQAHHHAHDRARRVELATFLAGGVCKVTDQEFIGSTQQIGELEIFIAQAVQAEMGDQLSQFDVGDLALSDLAGEVDVFEHVVEAGVAGFQSGQRLVQKITDVLVCVV